ncbi:MAG TPA: hypothetical protein VGJ05_00165 [Fimbriiglobus sp.]
MQNAHALQQPDVKPGRLIGGDPQVFREKFNRYCFEFTHELSNNPLFELPRLIELAKSMPPNDIFFNAGDVRVGQRASEIPPSKMSAEELLHDIEHSGAWILVKRARRDPEYAKLLDRGLAEFQDLTGGALPKDMWKRDALVFITSPNRVTSYHLDRECNFLLQIKGDKTIHIYDRYDRDVLPETELEYFWTKDNTAGTFKEHLLDRAKVFQLAPGKAVHIPVNSPHWLKNGDNISVTLSLNFQFKESVLGNIYKTNYLLRKVGFRPTPPGRSRILDTVKGSLFWPTLQLGSRAKAAVRRILPKRHT